MDTPAMARVLEIIPADIETEISNRINLDTTGGLTALGAGFISVDVHRPIQPPP